MKTRHKIEDDIVGKFMPHVTLTHDDETPMQFECIVAHPRQQNMDEILKDNKNTVVVTMDYSSADQPFIRTASDYMGEKRVPYLSGTIDIKDYTSQFIIAYPNVFTFPIVLNERRIEKMGMYIAYPTGSTSRIRVMILNEAKKSIWAKIFYSSELGTEMLHWFDFPVGVTAPTLNISLVIEDFLGGSNPIGMRLAYDSFVNPIVRFYACTVGRYVGKINLSTVRFQCIAKNKKIGFSPYPELFLCSTDIISQISQQLREHIWSNWTKFGLNDVRPSIIPANSPEIYYWEYLFFDVALVTKDIGGEPQQKYTLEQLDIQVTSR